MAKIADYELRKLGQQMIDLKDDLRDLINAGKFQFPITVNAVPGWRTNDGEMAFFTATATTDRRIYVRLDSGWQLFSQIFGGPGAPTPPAGPEGAVQVNSGGIFGGNNKFVWDSTGNTLTIFGSTTADTFPIRVLDINSLPTFRVTSGGAILVGEGSAGGGKLLIAMERRGTHPTATEDTIQLYGHAVGVNPRNFVILPPVGGPHLIGAAVVFSDAATSVIDLNGQAQFTVAGDQTVSSPAGINLGDGANNSRFSVTFASSADTTSLFGGPYMSLAVNANGGKDGFVLMNEGRQTSLIRENPCFVIGISTNTQLVQGAHLQWNSGQVIDTERATMFMAPRLHGVTDAAGGNVSAITNAATVFIEGPPIIATPGSLSVTNRYALWIGTGDILVGGKVITGGGNTSVNNGVLFTSTAISVSSNSTTENELIKGAVGTTSLVAGTLSGGRTIRLQAWGYYNTQLVPDTLRLSVLLGTTTIMTTGAQTPAGSVSTGGWSLNANIVCQTTGGAGTVIGQGDFPHFTGLTYANWPMVNSSTIVLNTTGAQVIRLLAQWGGTNAANQIFCTNAVGELLN